MGFIYKITSPTERIYVGKTNRLSQRIRDYRWRGKKRKSIVHDSIKGYGWAAHKFEIIEECSDEILSEREIFWIKELNSYFIDNPKGMNLTRGGEKGGRSWMHDIARRKWFSEKFKGKGSPFYGKHHTEENKRIIGEKTSERNKRTGHKVPAWGAEKGRLKIIVPILVYDSNGYLVKKFDSISDAVKFTKQSSRSIYKVCKSERTNAGGFIFRDFIENYPIKIEVGEIKFKTEKRPIYWMVNPLKIKKEFPSAKEASEYLGIPKTTINRAAMYNNLKPIRTGHIFIYKDKYLKEYKLSA